MSTAAGVPVVPVAERPSRRRRWIPFWVLQVMELAVAFIFVDISVHVDNSGLMVAGALAFALLAITANGPLGIVRICRPWLHLTLVVSVAVVVALAPVVPALRPDIEGIIVIEFGALGLIRLATLTDMSPSRRSRSGQPDRRVIEATATVAEVAPPPPVTPEPTRTAPPPAAGGAARWAGRAAGVVSASGRKAVADHGPEASRQVKRAIRGAGRLTGRVTSTEPEPSPDPDGPTRPGA
jgi:hypothetical protein